jgi:hypothetical protein
MRATEFILNEDRVNISEEYRRTSILLEQFCKQAVHDKFTARQILEMFEAVPVAGQAASQEVAAVQKGKQTLNSLTGNLSQGIQQAGEKIQNFDAKFDAYATKLAQKYPNTNKAIQAFRKFAHEHPVAEHAILVAVSLAAAISTPGIIGSAIVVGLLTTAYKLILGKNFSQSVKAGAASGALAGVLGSLVHGIDVLASAHHASPTLTKGVEQIVHGGLEGAGIGDLAPAVAGAMPTVAKAIGKGATLARGAGGHMVEHAKNNLRKEITA